MEKSKSIVMNKAYAFSIHIIGLCKDMQSQKKEYVLSKQLLRSGTAIGALIMEGEHAQSKADFLNKMNVALKEANETKYWLMLLHDTGYIDDRTFEAFLPDIKEILRLLVSIVKTTKNRLNR